MKLPGLPLFSKKDIPEYLLALLLRQEKATAVIIEQRQKGSTIVGTHEEYFETNLEDAPDAEWLRILDKTISAAEAKLPSSIETHKTVFGVPTTWVEEKHIKKEYLQKLKKTSEELALTPIGFLEIPEAIAHLLQEEEGVPVSAILAEIGHKYIAISVIKGGKIIDTKSGPLEETPTKTVDTLLRTIEGVDVLPSRIIVFNGGYDEKLVQAFIAHHWSKSLPFLHVPQITILPEEFDAKAVVFGAAAQIGFDILGALDVSEKDIKTFSGTKDHKLHEVVQEKVVEKESLEDDTTHEEELTSSPATTTPVTLENFGFVKEQDFALSGRSEEKHVEKPHHLHEEKEHTHQTHDEEKPERTFTVHSPSMHMAKEESNIAEPNLPDRQIRTEDAGSGEKKFSGLFTMPQSLLTLGQRIPRGNKKFLFIIPVVLILLIGLFMLYTNVVKATITLEVTPRQVDQDENITFAKDGNDFAQKVVEAKTTSVSLTGNASTPATGKKETGTNAKGTVTIFNSSENKRQLQAGTVIKSSNNLEYALDKEVTISSASGDIFSGIKSGTAQAAVTAKQIGTEFNVPSNTKFTIGDNDSLAAKNEQAFSGGTKKQITVVAEADVAKVTKMLPESLTTKARDALSDKFSSGETLLKVVPDFKPSKKDFNADVGQEAKTLTLSSSVTFEGIAYSNNDLLELTKTIIKDSFDDNLTVSNEDVKNTLKNVTEEDDGSLKAVLVINAKLLPRIKEEELRSQLAGKSFEDAKEILSRFPQVDTITITFFPPIPLLPEVLPGKEQNISLVVKTNE